MSMKELKSELKAIAKKIKETKIKTKEYQRDHGGDDGGFYCDIFKFKHDYRHKHIAYSQLRGRKYEEIESNCSRAGDPDFDLIKEIMDKHYEEKNEENVRACA